MGKHDDTTSRRARVTAVMIKPVPHEPMEALDTVQAVARHGLLGDCHASPLGPRQILVVRDEDLAKLGAGAWQVRANLAVTGLDPGVLRSGSVLRVGSHARIRITHECEICSVLRRYFDRETFRRLPGRRGSLGVILDGGEIALGAPVAVEEETRYPTVPDAIGDRAAWVIERIPPGRVLSYDTLLQLVGGKRAHFRVMPVYVKRAFANALPSHRVVTSAGRLSGHVAGQEQLLADEGVVITAGGAIDDKSRLWDGRTIFWRKR